MQENIGILLTKAIMLLALLLPILGLSQIEDDFSDGDLTNNPAWLGDISSFIINSDKQLQLNAEDAGSRTLIIPSSISDSMEWLFWIRLAFNPSSNNYARVYLASDEADLSGPLNGYYLQFGESGSGDAIELFK
ncbi:MAG: lamin tail domain-containing protein, partial [Bacteroidales bacterium]|nr:lamin tail domain-containing protein [Bacteroidales bacterium]